MSKLYAPSWLDLAGHNIVPGEEIPEEHMDRLPASDRAAVEKTALRDPEIAAEVNADAPMYGQGPLPSYRAGEKIHRTKKGKLTGEVTPLGRKDKAEYGTPQSNLDVTKQTLDDVGGVGSTPPDELAKLPGNYRTRANHRGGRTGGAIDTNAPSTGHLEYALMHLMRPETMATIAQAGKSGADWYDTAGRELGDMMGADAPRFLALLAGTSARKAVQANFRIAVQTWNAWIKAGRPTGHALNNLMNHLIQSGPYDPKNPHQITMMMRGDKAKAMLALGSDDPGQKAWSVLFDNGEGSPYKLDSFRLNLQGDPDKVTNDVWMAKLFKIGQTMLAKPEWYIAANLNVRRASDLLNQQLQPGEKPWTPRRVQAAAWTWGKSLAELMGMSRSHNHKGEGRRFPEGQRPINPAEALAIHTNGDVHAAADFYHTLVFGQDRDSQIVRDILLHSPYAKGFQRLVEHARDDRAEKGRADYLNEPAADARTRDALEPAARELARSMVTGDRTLMRGRNRRREPDVQLSRKRRLSKKTAKNPAKECLHGCDRVRYAADALRPDGSVAPPTVQRDSSFDQSFAMTGSANHKALVQQTNATLRRLGLKGSSAVGIGDFDNKAEPSVMQTVQTPHDAATLQYAAAWYGLHANQSSVLVFHPDPKGPDSTYTIDVAGGDIRSIRKALDQAGIPQRTLIPHNGGVKVVVYDSGRQWRKNVGKFASQHNAPVIEAIGRGKYLGSGRRSRGNDADAKAAARAKYRQIIDAYESRRGGAGQGQAGGSGIQPQ